MFYTMTMENISHYDDTYMTPAAMILPALQCLYWRCRYARRMLCGQMQHYHRTYRVL